MSGVVLDASAALAWCFEDETQGAAGRAGIAQGPAQRVAARVKP